MIAAATGEIIKINLWSLHNFTVNRLNLRAAVDFRSVHCSINATVNDGQTKLFQLKSVNEAFVDVMEDDAE